MSLPEWRCGRPDRIHLRLDVVTGKAGIQPVKYPLQIEFVRFRGADGCGAGSVRFHKVQRMSRRSSRRWSGVAAVAEGCVLSGDVEMVSPAIVIRTLGAPDKRGSWAGASVGMSRTSIVPLPGWLLAELLAEYLCCQAVYD